jgi:hypothetical protein
VQLVCLFLGHGTDGSLSIVRPHECWLPGPRTEHEGAEYARRQRPDAKRPGMASEKACWRVGAATPSHTKTSKSCLSAPSVSVGARNMAGAAAHVRHHAARITGKRATGGQNKRSRRRAHRHAPRKPGRRTDRVAPAPVSLGSAGAGQSRWIPASRQTAVPIRVIAIFAAAVA